MQNSNNIYVSQNDYDKLSSLLANVNSEVAEQLEEELGRATIVNENELPGDVVTMGSRVQFIDLDSAQESTVTLVYPNKANIEEGRISILAPIGSALIGLRVDQTIDWPLPNGKTKRLKVVSVTHEDEGSRS